MQFAGALCPLGCVITGFCGHKSLISAGGFVSSTIAGGLNFPLHWLSVCFRDNLGAGLSDRQIQEVKG